MTNRKRPTKIRSLMVKSLDESMSSALYSPPIAFMIEGEYKADDIDSSSDLTISERIFVGLFLFVILGVFTLIAVFTQGCAGWGLYAFLIPFYAFFPWIAIGSTAGIGLLIVYIIGMAILKIIIGRTGWGKEKLKKCSSSSGGFSGSRWSNGCSVVTSSWSMCSTTSL